jgi:hypothetical protein
MTWYKAGIVSMAAAEIDSALTSSLLISRTAGWMERIPCSAESSREWSCGKDRHHSHRERAAERRASIFTP